MSISKLVLNLAMMAIVVTGTIGQSQKALDLRYQLKEPDDEAVDALRYSATYASDSHKPEFPLVATIRSIGPISEEGRDVAEVAFQNIGNGVFRFPVSLERKLLHARGNSDRRSMLCSIQLTHDTSGPMLSKHANGFHTFGSVLDNTSFVELRPKDTFVMTFEARFALLFEDRDYQWKDLIRSGVLQAGVRCDQQVYDPLPPGGEEERKYSIALSSIQSTNMARLSMAP